MSARILIEGTTPAGKAPRYLTVQRDESGAMQTAIFSASNNFLADIRITGEQATEVALMLDPTITTWDRHIQDKRDQWTNDAEMWGGRRP